MLLRLRAVWADVTESNLISSHFHYFPGSVTESLQGARPDRSWILVAPLIFWWKQCIYIFETALEIE